MAMTTNDETGAGIGTCAPLLEIATPDVYARNPFRVLGAGVDSSIRDVQREQQRRAMQEKLGVASGPADSALFPVADDPDVQRAALEALARPIDRLLAELFWFWPLDGDDAARDALADGALEGARGAWEAALESEPAVARHNLAVLHHALALEAGSARRTDAERDDAGPALEHAALALEHWSAVVDDEDFWHALRERALAMDDRRLTTGFVRQVRRTLPTALLAIHAKIAHAAGAAGDLARARAQVSLIRESSFSERLAEDAIREALGPVRNRIRQAVDDATARWTSAPQRGATIVRELIAVGRDLLEVVDQMLPEGDPTRASLHDDLADAMLIGQVAYGRATDDWETSTELLKLALEVVEGPTSRRAIEKNLGIVEGNTTGQNRWCAPGYWDLPDEVLTPLEAAHDKARAGDYDGAIADLVDMDPAVGPPLVRAMAHALSRRGSETRERAVGTFNAERGVIKRIMDKLRNMGEHQRAVTLMRQPDPTQYAHMNPPCLACGGGYSSWVNLTYNDVPLFMCSTCGEQHDRDQEDARRALRAGLATALEYVQLAHELDADDPDVEMSVESLKTDAKSVDGRIPTTESLRGRLGGKRMRRRPVDAPSSAYSDDCHFCGEGPGDEDASLIVPMCGDVESADFLLGEGRACATEDVVVPRCSSCRDQHERLREDRAAWLGEREDAGADSAFPELLEKLALATSVADRARDAIEDARQEQRRAEQAVEDARVPSICDRCSSDAEWKDGLCGTCDAELFTTSVGERGLVAGLGLAAFANLFMGPGTGLIRALSESYSVATGITMTSASGRIAFAGTGFIVAAVVLLFRGLTVRKRIERTEVGATRLREFAEANLGAVEAATSLVSRAAAAVAQAEEDASGPEADRLAATEELDAAKAAAQAEYEATHPWPELPERVVAEPGYLEFGVIAERVAAGWGFGSEPRDDGTVGAEPQNVRGLVA